MDRSLTLLSAQIHFLDTELALIHIPLPLYSLFVQPILQLLIPARTSAADTTTDPSTDDATARQRRPWAYTHPFVNVSVTPVECSVACSRALADRLFVPVIESLDEAAREQVAISSDSYIVVQVDGDGEALEAGQRVVELTAPLAMNGISIFFVTTYFSDYILVPVRSRTTVISALEAGGFVFESNTEAFVNISSPLLSAHSRNTSAGPTQDNPFETSLAVDDRPPGTPPPSTVQELQARTFALMSRHSIAPTVDSELRLVQVAGRKTLSMRSGTPASQAAAHTMALRLHLGLVRCIIRAPRPRFFSVTLTDTEPASLLLERDLLTEFEPEGSPEGIDDGDVLLLGRKDDALVPVTFDLRRLPVESTGIVCGVAGKLVDGMRTRPASADSSAENRQDAVPVEMSYLSTARAGTVMVAEAELDRALAVLGMTSSVKGLGLGVGEGPASEEVRVGLGLSVDTESATSHDTETKPIAIRGARQ